MKCARIESKLRNIFSRSRFSPVTLEIWNIGHTLRKILQNYYRGKRYITFVTVIMIMIAYVNMIVIVIVTLWTIVTVCLLGSQFRD